MLRQQKHYSEGKQSSSGVTSRNHTKVNVYGFRIIYIMLTYIDKIKKIIILKTKL